MGSKVKGQTERELKSRLKKIEEDRDDLRWQLKRFQEQEEEERQELQRQYLILDEMRECVSSNDRRILEVIEETQGLMNSIRINKREMADSLIEIERKKNIEWDMEEEDIREQQRILSEEETEDFKAG